MAIEESFHFIKNYEVKWGRLHLGNVIDYPSDITLYLDGESVGDIPVSGRGKVSLTTYMKGKRVGQKLKIRVDRETHSVYVDSEVQGPTLDREN